MQVNPLNFTFHKLCNKKFYVNRSGSRHKPKQTLIDKLKKIEQFLFEDWAYTRSDKIVWHHPDPWEGRLYRLTEHAELLKDECFEKVSSHAVIKEVIKIFERIMRYPHVGIRDWESYFNQAILWKRNPAVVETLISMGFDLEQVDQYGDTPLLNACEVDDVAIAKSLINAKANVNARGYQGHVPVTTIKDTCEIFELLRDARADFDIVLHLHKNETPLFLAVQAGHLTKFQKLIESRVNIHHRNSEGETLLHKAVWCIENPELLFTLIQLGVDVNAVDCVGKNALMHICYIPFVHNSERFKALVDAGTDLTIVNKDGETAVDMAKKARDSDLVKFLTSAQQKHKLG